MPGRAGERGTDENLRERDRLLDGLLTRADAEHVGVIVQAGQPRRLLVPGQSRAHTANLVGRDLLAVAGSADDDPEAAWIGDGGAGRAHDIRRVDRKSTRLNSVTVASRMPSSA